MPLAPRSRIGHWQNISQAGRPRLLFEGPYLWGGYNPGFQFYAVLPGGQRIIMLRSQREAGPTRINVALNWSPAAAASAEADRR